MKNHVDDKVKRLIASLSTGRQTVLEEAILSRLDGIQEGGKLDYLNDKNINRHLRLMNCINRTILEENSKIDKIFYRKRT